jgi:hypothetical protein
MVSASWFMLAAVVLSEQILPWGSSQEKSSEVPSCEIGLTTEISNFHFNVQLVSSINLQQSWARESVMVCKTKEQVILSLTPNFSWVYSAPVQALNRFSGLAL